MRGYVDCEECEQREVNAMRFKRLAHLEVESLVEPPTKDMLGYQVYDCFGKFVGVVDDLLADADTPEAASYALIGQGHVAVMLNGRELIVPLDRLDVDDENKEVNLSVALERLHDFPVYNTLQDPNLKDRVDSFWASTARPIAA